MFVNMNQILHKSKEGKYGVIAPNVCNETTAYAAIQCAVENRAPLIIDLIYDVNPNIPLLAKMIIEMANDVDVPVALNLDHSNTFEKAIISLKAGFSSIMVDRSKLPFNENVKQVAELVKIAHVLGVSVEAELGHVGMGFQYDVDRNAGLTHPDEAVEFVKQTGVDALAIAIGTAHGTYSGTPYLDFELLKKIYDLVDIPLVLHGGSGTGDENLSKVSKEGITKINIGTDLFKAGNQALVNGYQALRRPNEAFGLYIEGYKKELTHYMKLVGECGKAD